MKSNSQRIVLLIVLILYGVFYYMTENLYAQFEERSRETVEHKIEERIQPSYVVIHWKNGELISKRYYILDENGQSKPDHKKNELMGIENLEPSQISSDGIENKQ